MIEINVRELKAKISYYLKSLKDGEIIKVNNIIICNAETLGEEKILEKITDKPEVREKLKGQVIKALKTYNIDSLDYPDNPMLPDGTYAKYYDPDELPKDHPLYDLLSHCEVCKIKVVRRRVNGKNVCKNCT